MALNAGKRWPKGQREDVPWSNERNLESSVAVVSRPCRQSGMPLIYLQQFLKMGQRTANKAAQLVLPRAVWKNCKSIKIQFLR